MCTATCPVYVDVRGMLAEIVKGDYTTASKGCCRVLTPQMTQRYLYQTLPRYTQPAEVRVLFSAQRMV